MSDAQNVSEGQSGSFLHRLNAENATQVMEQTKAVLDQSMEAASTFIRKRPIACLAGALALGYVIGKTASR
jgi:hypothetical protein